MKTTFSVADVREETSFVGSNICVRLTHAPTGITASAEAEELRVAWQKALKLLERAVTSPQPMDEPPVNIEVTFFDVVITIPDMPSAVEAYNRLCEVLAAAGFEWQTAYYTVEGKPGERPTTELFPTHDDG